jgi:hypothetical protein
MARRRQAKALTKVLGRYAQRSCAWCGGKFTPLHETTFYCSDRCSLAMSAACGEAPAKWLVGAKTPLAVALDYARRRKADPARRSYREGAGRMPAEAPVLA